MFEGFSEETIRFFLELRFHNESSFFQEHRAEYEEYVKKPFYSLIETLAPTVDQVADDMETRPVKCLARIHRDTRFSKDKSPYRDHMWLLLRRSGEERHNAAMYWFELSPERVVWGLGFWDAERATMNEIRRQLVEKPTVWTRALKRCSVPGDGLDVYGERYRRMAIPPDLPQSLQELYPLKDLYIQRNDIPLRMAYSSEIADRFAEDILRLKPIYQLLRKAADDGRAALQG